MFSDKTVIPSTRQLKDLDSALSSKSEYVLLSEAHIGNLKELTKRCHQAGKKVLVHLDLIEGLTKDAKGVKWLKEMFKVDGVISPNQRVLNTAMKLDLLAIYRVFLLDSRSLEQALKSLENINFDGVEVLPGPFAIHYVNQIQSIIPNTHLLAGGFLDSKVKIETVFRAGFSAVTTSQKELW
ncbi:glycerol-3-phosphate responsive antiterminator [Peribacillus butanolivorans]|uniref:glycerol-3-phosphate responsive antiterminator n=1 Tax=Peribacillus TaxID=2675229 RepID=UPI00191473C3|nr:MULTISPECIES: glycerol-3-phosphate responsive antiterminator [unclassified Peribacillus]MBK5441644.1 glycerol-3-phosphate responsive antiterminator [Peribacillus sp. TH24]MBK5458434.1 glycerol-3-phosphate responsive antiterminator [Peribacillus sp. TH27]MBK5483048.1 glycerol-3-phosphate responsive antiterminator [Peribacillus sp. TH16]MBK5501837.1 glycerol-3-phosphate responsive antiterminator [Peribacillus sp. TH14]WMX53236.1 glycerol-3-phosphate responsive antiterminator [Peribacillus sp.